MKNEETESMESSESTNSRELVRKAIEGHTTSRTPWVPFVGCHAGALLGIPADDYLQSADHIVQGIQAAIERYQPDGIPVMFDLQLEAEALGCKLKWATDNPPAVVEHLLNKDGVLDKFRVPQPDQGRLGLVLEATRRLREANPDIALYGTLTGPFTLALHLQGTDIFMRMFDNPSQVRQLLEFTRDVALAMSQYYLEAGCDVIAVVDPMTSQIGPEQFEEFVTPYVSPVFDFVTKHDGLSSFFVCGHAQQNIQAMCDCRPHNICVDENIPLDFVRDICRPRGVSFGGNMQLTTVLLLGKTEDAEKNAVNCLEIGQNEGFILAPGCDLPYATPPANLEIVGKLVRDTYRQNIVQTMATSQGVEDILDMSQYGHSDKVVVDIITLDSEACTPCQYMVESVKRIAPEFEGIVQWREHKIKHREEIVFMTSLFVKNVPTICIDGQITFVSRIPPKDELIAAIQNRINQKMRDRIRQRRASLYVLGTDTKACEQVRENVQRAITELGSDIKISIVHDEEEIHSFGVQVSQTPAVVTAEYQLKSTKHLPEPAIIKEWIKALQ